MGFLGEQSDTPPGTQNAETLIPPVLDVPNPTSNNTPKTDTTVNIWTETWYGMGDKVTIRKSSLDSLKAALKMNQIIIER